MAVLEVKAYAKLNLSLDVLGKRPDGYHDMRMVMQSVTLTDTLRLETGTGRPLRMESNLGFLPADESNLAAAAALRLCEEAGVDHGGLPIKLDKTIPVCAGMAGGPAGRAPGPPRGGGPARRGARLLLYPPCCATVRGVGGFRRACPDN